MASGFGFLQIPWPLWGCFLMRKLKCECLKRADWHLKCAFNSINLALKDFDFFSSYPVLVLAFLTFPYVTEKVVKCLGGLK